MSRYFYHGVSSIASTLKILQSGSIQCRRLLGKKANGYNGFDYVSVCKKYAEEDYQNTDLDNAFYKYVQNYCCFILSEEIPAMKTFPTKHIGDYPMDTILFDKQKRVSDMFDEWQVYREIPLSFVVGIGIPCDYFLTIIRLTSPSNETIREMKEIIQIACSLGLDIVDTNVQGFAEEYEKQKLDTSRKVYQISKKLEEAINHE